MDLLELLDSATAEIDWLDSAACAGEQPELFVNPDLDDVDGLRRAMAVCGRCSVRARCDAYAAERGETGAIWGGVLR